MLSTFVRAGVCKVRKNRDSDRTRVSGFQSLKLLAEARQPIVGAEAAAEPVEAQEPPATEPAQARHIQDTIRIAPNRASENQIVASPFFGNVLLLGQQSFSMELTSQIAEFFGALVHGFTRNNLFFSLQKTIQADDDFSTAYWSVGNEFPIILALVKLELGRKRQFYFG